jgi:hypothetical protein
VGVPYPTGDDPSRRSDHDQLRVGRPPDVDDADGSVIAIRDVERDGWDWPQGSSGDIRQVVDGLDHHVGFGVDALTSPSVPLADRTRAATWAYRPSGDIAMSRRAHPATVCRRDGRSTTPDVVTSAGVAPRVGQA